MFVGTVCEFGPEGTTVGIPVGSIGVAFTAESKQSSVHSEVRSKILRQVRPDRDVTVLQAGALISTLLAAVLSK